MIKITNLELENIKRIKAVQLAPSESGLTVIGGNNGQGKTSVLDGIAWALGGDKFKPSQPQRDGSVIPPHLRVTLSNGLIVERKGDRGTLKITDPNGGKGGQQLLNEFIGQLALDLPKFMQATSKEKAQTLLRIIGVGDKLAAPSGRSPTRSRSTPTSSRTTPKPPPRRSAFPSCSAVSRRYSRRTAKISACGRTAIYASRNYSAPGRSTTAPRKSSPAHSRQPRPPASPPPTSRTKAPPKSNRAFTTSTLSTRKSGQGASVPAPSRRRRRPASSTTS